VGFCLVFGAASLSGQTANPVTGDALEAADRLTKAGLYDQALSVLEPVYVCLEEQGALNELRGIWVRQQLAFNYRRTNQEERAVALALPLVEDARRAGLFREQAYALLTLAAVYLGSKQFEKSRETLLQCGALIQRVGLDSVRSRFAIRKCSHFTAIRQLDSVRYYAELALEESTRFGQRWEQAHAYTLLNDAFPDTTYQFYLDNLQRFANYQREVENYTVLSQALTIMSIYLHENDRLAEAKLLNDSTFYYLAAMERRGQNTTQALAGAHRERMKIFEALSQPDSALYHAKQFFENEIKYREARNLAAIREVEAQYADNVKAEKIRQQEEQLLQRHRERLLLLLILGLILIGAGLLFYFNRKLGRVNRSLADQSSQLERTNQELGAALEHQEMLRGELHHRVKNNLQVIISMLDLQEWNTDNERAKQSIHAMSERIYSIASVHELLYPERSGELIDFRTYLNKLCTRAALLWPPSQSPEFTLDLPGTAMNLDTLVPLGIVVSELLTNTRKYFGSTQRQPRIRIALHQADTGFCLEYLDNGPGFAAAEMPERPGGLGRYLLFSMSRQLRGRVETFNADGAGTRFYFQPKNMEFTSAPATTAT
jgi:two-component sensor histidine kinase